VLQPISIYANYWKQDSKKKERRGSSESEKAVREIERVREVERMRKVERTSEKGKEINIPKTGILRTLEIMDKKKEKGNAKLGIFAKVLPAPAGLLCSVRMRGPPRGEGSS